MKIFHIRSYNKKKGDGGYCITHIYVDGKYYCDAIEDYDRGLDESMTEAEARRIKVPSKTAIPTGHYTVKMNIVSPKFSQSSYAGGYYKQFCGGRVPRLDPVLAFQGILIHRGTNENSSAGCIIVGWNTVVGQVTESRKAFEGLFKMMKDAADRGETISYTVTRKYKV